MQAKWNQNSQTVHATAFVFLATSLLHPPQGYFLFTIFFDFVGKLGEEAGAGEREEECQGSEVGFWGSIFHFTIVQFSILDHFFHL